MSSPQLITGQSPKPAKLRVAIIDKPYAWDDLGPRGFAAAWLHRTIGGAIETTDEYFRNPNAEGYRRALTDFGIGLSGLALMWNDPWGRRAPWASGPFNGGEGDGPAYVNAYGVHGINRDGISFEFEGRTFDSPTTEAQILTGIETIGWVMDHKGIPYTSHPVHPDTALSLYMSHWESCGQAYKRCAGSVIDALISTRFIPGVAAYLKHWQTRDDIGTPPQPPAPVLTPSKPPRLETTVQRIGSATWQLVDQKVWIGNQPVWPLKWATPKSNYSRSTPLPAGSWVNAVRLVRVDNPADYYQDNPYYWVTSAGHRIPAVLTRQLPGVTVPLG